MRKAEFKELPVNQAERIDFTVDERIIGITIKNQGTNTVVSSFGSSGLLNQILPGNSEAYGGVDGYYLMGYVMIDFTGAGTPSAVVKMLYDRGEINDC